MSAEFFRWQSNWLRHQSEFLPNDPLQALIIAEEMDSYPSLAFLIQILSYSTNHNCHKERSFSALKYLKTYLRNTTKEVRLNDLALLYVHRDISLILNKMLLNFCVEIEG